MSSREAQGRSPSRTADCCRTQCPEGGREEEEGEEEGEEGRGGRGEGGEGREEREGDTCSYQTP